MDVDLKMIAQIEGLREGRDELEFKALLMEEEYE